MARNMAGTVVAFAGVEGFSNHQAKISTLLHLMGYPQWKRYDYSSKQNSGTTCLFYKRITETKEKYNGTAL